MKPLPSRKSGSVLDVSDGSTLFALRSTYSTLSSHKFFSIFSDDKYMALLLLQRPEILALLRRPAVAMNESVKPAQRRKIRASIAEQGAIES